MAVDGRLDQPASRSNTRLRRAGSQQEPAGSTIARGRAMKSSSLLIGCALMLALHAGCVASDTLDPDGDSDAEGGGVESSGGGPGSGGGSDGGGGDGGGDEP